MNACLTQLVVFVIFYEPFLNAVIRTPEEWLP